jgi:NAD(P)-dependent dehydrogenase (short-subunit alcohol dehydrogenase family)
MHARPVAVVTGANRGIGLEVARQLDALGWTVVLTARDAADARGAAATIGPDVDPQPLDVTDADQARALAEHVRAAYGRVDAVVNNAGAVFDDHADPSVLNADPAALLRTWDVNTLGPLRVAQAFLPLLEEGGGGNLVNVSSGMGGLAEMGSGYVASRLSKVALNGLTRLLHNEHGGAGVRVNSVCPGWVKTPLGGPGATREVPEGAAGVVWAATLGPDGPSGGFFRDREPIPW